MYFYFYFIFFFFFQFSPTSLGIGLLWALWSFKRPDVVERVQSVEKFTIFSSKCKSEKSWQNVRGDDA